METRLRIQNEYGDKKVVIFTTGTPSHVGAVALALLERWAMVCGVEDGEDSSGRSKLRSLTPTETVARAFDTAEAFFALAAERGHIVAVPDLNELNAERDAEVANDAARAKAKKDAREAASAAQ